MIYESSTIRVEDCTIDGDRTNVVVTFPFARGKDGFRDPFGKEFFARRAISAIHITISTSNWFQSEELNAALSAVRTRTAQFDRVVTYGQSMGGYGAIAASAAVGAHAILAMAPQFSLDRAKVPWEKRWPVQHTAIVDGGGYVRDELEELIAPEAELYLVYDPRTVDSRHVDLIILSPEMPYRYRSHLPGIKSLSSCSTPNCCRNLSNPSFAECRLMARRGAKGSGQCGAASVIGGWKFRMVPVVAPPSQSSLHGGRLPSSLKVAGNRS